MAPIGGPHRGTVILLDELLHNAVGKRATVLCQSFIRLGEYSEPEPDLAILRRDLPRVLDAVGRL